MHSSSYLKWLRVIGVDPHHFPPIHIFITSIVILTEILMEFLKIYIFGDLQLIEGIADCIQVTIKYGTLIVYRKAVLDVLKDMKNFWEDHVTDKKIHLLKQYTIRIQIFYISICSVEFCLFVMKPLFLQNTSIFNGYRPPPIPFPIYYSLQFIFLVYMMACYLGFNFLICNLIIALAIQFRLMNIRIRDLDFQLASESEYGRKKSTNDLKQVVKYQLTLIRCVEKLDAILSVPLALIISVSICILCVNTYTCLIQNTSEMDRKRILMVNFSLIQEFLLIYGLPSQLLMNEAENTANTIYTECKWYLPNIASLRKDVLMVIIRSQRSVSIKAANYHLINNQTVVIMLKTAYTFFTFLQSVT